MERGKYRVLVLGAGASMPYGYPSGAQLRSKILNIDHETAVRSGIIDGPGSADAARLDSFLMSFRYSQMYSIDAFLGKRTEYSDIGKRCIAHVLLGCESEVNLMAEAVDKDHWYQLLFNSLAKSNWEDLDFQDIAVVTFNYDRSLELYLYIAFQAAYGKLAEQVRDKLKALNIVHVYGGICEHLPGVKGFLRYDGKTDHDKVAAAARGLEVIPEGRENGDRLIRARQLLEGARDICFLGFGFDQINVQRLSLDGALGSTVLLRRTQLIRGHCGTRLGLTDSEVLRAVTIMDEAAKRLGSIRSYQAVNCTTLLRETLFLERDLG